jgi:hypothetical protein
MRPILHFQWLGWLAAAAITAVAAVASPRYLFLDPAILASSENATLHVRPPEAREVVIRPDRPWEQLMISFFLTVRDEGEKLRLWYICRDGQNQPNVAYAESVDGVHWTKPNLGIVEYDGNRDNNLVGIPNLEGVVFRDDSASADERYVYLTNVYHEGVIRFYSPDGLRWQKSAEILLPFESDTQNVTFWDQRIGRYVMYLRGWDPGTDTTRRRKVVRLELDDYRGRLPLRPSGRITHPASAAPTRLPWIVDEIPTVLAVDQDDPPMTDIYNLSAQPYPLDPSWYVGFPSFYRHRPESDDPPYENGGRTEIHFVGSRDGVHWQRYDRAVYIAPGLVETGRGNMAYMGTGLVVRGDEIWHYATGFHSQHGDVAARQARTDGQIVRYVQRLDGFVSLTTADTPGEARTVPVRVSGRQLRLNLDTGGLGALQVGLVDADGERVSGYGLDQCDPLQINSTGALVTWNGQSDLGDLIGRDVALVFRSSRTRLFSFRFE